MKFPLPLSRRSGWVAGLAGVLLAGTVAAQIAVTLRPGPIEQGLTLLPSGWPIAPAGRQVDLGEMPQASAISPDERYLLVLNGGNPASISVLDTATLNEQSRVPLESAGLGLVFSDSGAEVYVAGGSNNAVYEFTFSREGVLAPGKTMLAEAGEGVNFIGDVAIPPNGRLVYATDVLHDRIVVFNPQTGLPIGGFKTGRRPRQILFHPDGSTMFVSSWADATILQHQTNSGAELSRIRVAPHPTGMVLSDRKADDETRDAASAPKYRLFVTAANTNNILTVEIDADRVMRSGDVLNVGYAPTLPAGMTPLALTLSPDQTQLYVACADANVVAVVDVTELRGRLAGFLPTGAYPASLQTMRDGRLAVMNSSGGAGGGTMSVVDRLTPESLNTFSDAALELVAYQGSVLPGQQPRLPVENVIYILTDGRTGEGRAATPNYAKLEREFVAFLNFHARSAVVDEGLGWLLAGTAPNFTRLLAPKYGNAAVGPDFDAAEPANFPPAGYLWTNVISSGAAVRNYGVFVTNGAAGGSAEVAKVKDAALAPVTNLNFRGPDRAVPDSQRARVFLEDFQSFAESGEVPRLMLVRMAGDGAAETLADHDAAIGAIVEAVSKSRLWSTTAIVIVPAANSAEWGEANAHLISAYTHRAETDVTLYSHASVLRTVERILGLRPITFYDASSVDLSTAFGVFRPEPFIAE